MKKRILISLTIIFLLFLIIGLYVKSLLQEDKYSSKEESEYYKNSKSFPFKPLDTTFILGFHSEYYEIQKAESNYEPYSPNKSFTPYTDSIYSMERTMGYDMQKIEIESIGKIEKTNILKYEKKDSIEAFVYESSEYESFLGDPGIWIGYSENNGKDWRYYYTGIVQRQPVFIKYYSKRPLIKEKGKLEIDACLLRQLSPIEIPVGLPSYECVQDGIYVVFDINVIAKDSDGDGLTDIVEDKLYLNKYNKDTDGDGIPDNLDANPRVHYPRTEKSKVYEAILTEDIGHKDMDWFFGRLVFNGNNTVYHVTDSTKTVLIVTDDKDLMGIQPQEYRVIFMTKDEYKNRANPYDSDLNRMYFSPLFKIDNKKNTYVVSYGGISWDDEYLVKKMIIGWRIKSLSTTIS